MGNGERPHLRVIINNELKSNPRGDQRVSRRGRITVLVGTHGIKSMDEMFEVRRKMIEEYGENAWIVDVRFPSSLSHVAWVESSPTPNN
jgi:hypothetical protein